MDFSFVGSYSGDFLEGFKNTIYASLLGLAGSFVLGLVLAVMRIAPWKALRAIGTAYVEFFRNIPLLLVVYIFYLGLPSLGADLDGFASGTLGLMIYTSAFIAEAVRAGIQSVPAGQMEAARSTGLSYVQAMRLVILPQAVRIVIPPITNQFLNLVKNSSILGVVAGFDLMYFADNVNSYTFQTMETYMVAAAFYLILTVPLAYATNVLERKLARTG
ncbi:amino acid ABC transporter permease [Paenibacillus pasadenensis]|uniref:Glutamate transport membrane-spanning protein n=1 Tax=Paenibacillus pasadenensis TaxID=217090 RepID=A0A2N5N2J0_9BACL|nr:MULTISPECIES: amino acid ABC transporter permease [Paenibacillus]PLT44543.1 Glutamate transport membrane-spanning protein [Paenibacillus pasadenensis]QGG55007.1 ABC transporter permease subunit [Paenibacillus sp. B01]